jgi:hypothetical protein
MNGYSLDQLSRSRWCLGKCVSAKNYLNRGVKLAFVPGGMMSEAKECVMIEGFWIVQYEGMQGNGGGVAMFIKDKCSAVTLVIRTWGRIEFKAIR